MKKYIVFFLLISFYSCSESEPSGDDCVWKDEIQKVFDRNNETPCTYTDVYILNDELFTICHCCNCNKIIEVLNCQGRNICVNDESCRESFLEKADYQFSFE